MNLDEPVDLLRELEEHSPLEFRVRRTADDSLVLDVDDDRPGSPRRLAARLLRLTPAFTRGCSSAGRASRWQREGQGFEPPQLHQVQSADDGPLFETHMALARPRGRFRVGFADACGGVGRIHLYRQMGQRRLGDGQFRAPYGMVADSFGNVYVTDLGNGMGNNDRVEKFDSNGAFLKQWGTLASGDTTNSTTRGASPPTPQATSSSPTPATTTSRIRALNGVFALKFGGAAGDGPISSCPFGVRSPRSGRQCLRRRPRVAALATVDRVQRVQTVTGRLCL